jgi:hypothetical protein
MQIATFLAHHQVRENPFRAEEARHDEVFERIDHTCHHPDFEKIRGDFLHPSSAIVCGEKGSGKTAIRLQMEQAAQEHNQAHPDRRCLVVAYDDFNAMLDHLHRHAPKAAPQELLGQVRLCDHMDAILMAVVPGMVDQVLGELRGKAGPLELDAGPRGVLRLDRASRRDLLLLQACYDRPQAAPRRSRRLARMLRIGGAGELSWWKWASILSAAVAVGLAVTYLLKAPQQANWLWQTLLALAALLALGVAARLGWLWLRLGRLAAGLARHLRVSGRGAASFRASLSALRLQDLLAAELPCNQEEQPRYAMFARLLDLIRPLGYRSIVVLVDRVDEPTLISGDPRRMRGFVWPLFNHKFLQQESIGLKLLLPIELRYLVGREGEEFFREARFDKQNFIERLSWSGATLYDLCTARLNACRPEGEPPIALDELFDDSISQQELIDVLDQMQQPRDAFKFLYQLIQEHCANVAEGRPAWTIARPTLDSVRRAQSERMSAMLRGMAPA